METQVLLVEDDATARLLLGEVLTGAGYDVTTAQDGETALELLSKQTFDVVITDIRMRKVGGIQVLYAAKQYTSSPAVILLTGYGSLETALEALRAGAYDYLLKPVDPNDLLERVEGAMQRRQSEQRQNNAVRIIAQGLAQLQGHVPLGDQPERRDNRVVPEQPPHEETRYITVGLLTIDSFRHTASFDGHMLHLTPIEYALLRCLAESTGRVLTYREIVRCSHGHEPEETEAQSLLKAHIRNLRRKIASDYLVNVRGTGYMLVDPETAPDAPYDEDE